MLWTMSQAADECAAALNLAAAFAVQGGTPWVVAGQSKVAYEWKGLGRSHGVRSLNDHACSLLWRMAELRAFAGGLGNNVHVPRSL